MTHTRFNTLLTCLTDDQTPRVWSLLVTVFGDLAQDPDARISGAVMGHLTGLLGVKPEAMRVALHRLRKDGWIESVREGRSSSSALTDFGRAQSIDASPRIYSTDPPKTAWLVLRGGASNTPTIIAEPPQDPDAFATLLTPDTPMPPWLRATVCPPDLATASAAFAKRLDILSAKLPDARDLSASEVAALRVLIVHGWRRIVLKAPALPDHVFPLGWQGSACRTSVTTLLKTLPKPRIRDLSDEI